MTRLMLVCLGGALGSGARYLVSVWMLGAFGAAFPWGTLAVNLAGSFVLAALLVVASTSTALPASAWIGLSAGVLGGFTTYSTFSYETFRYLQDGAWDRAALYAGVTVVGGLLACTLGFAAGRAIAGQ